MYEEIKELFDTRQTDPPEVEEKSYNQIWEEKGDFVTNVLLGFGRHAITLEHEGATYKEKRDSVDTVLSLATRPTKKPPIDEKKALVVFKSFRSPDYEPPTRILELAFHLSCLWLYYNELAPDMEEVPLNAILRMDLVMAKLVRVACVAIAGIRKQWEKDARKRGRSGLTEYQKILTLLAYNLMPSKGKTDTAKATNVIKFLKSHVGEELEGIKVVEKRMPKNVKTVLKHLRNAAIIE